VDEKEAAYAVAKANVSAARAELDRLGDLQRFETVSAPFDGIVSARNIDVGTLIDAGSGAELFHLTQNDVIRVYIDVPQEYVRAIRPGVRVDVLVPEFPGRVFSGPVVRAAGALNSATRTLQTEVQIANPRGELLPGMSGQARLRISSVRPPLVLPSDAVIVRADGARVAVIGADRRIAFRKIVLGRDFGQRVEVITGLDEGAVVVSNPSDALSDGMIVDVVQRASGAVGKP
jgi:RND family efflux transporter MFP subunit